MEKKALPVVIVSIKSVHQLPFRQKRKMNMAGAKPVTSKQMREVKELEVPACGKIDNNTCTVGLEKAVLPVPPRPLEKSRYQLHLPRQRTLNILKNEKGNEV